MIGYGVQSAQERMGFLSGDNLKRLTGRAGFKTI